MSNAGATQASGVPRNATEVLTEVLGWSEAREATQASGVPRERGRSGGGWEGAMSNAGVRRWTDVAAIQASGVPSNATEVLTEVLGWSEAREDTQASGVPRERGRSDGDWEGAMSNAGVRRWTDVAALQASGVRRNATEVLTEVLGESLGSGRRGAAVEVKGRTENETATNSAAILPESACFRGGVVVV